MIEIFPILSRCIKEKGQALFAMLSNKLKQWLVGALFFAQGALLYALYLDVKIIFRLIICLSALLIGFILLLIRPIKIGVLINQTPLPVKLLFLYLAWNLTTVLWAPAFPDTDTLGSLIFQLSLALAVLYGSHDMPSESYFLTGIKSYTFGGMISAVAVILMSTGSKTIRVGLQGRMIPTIVGYVMGLGCMFSAYLLFQSKSWLGKLLAFLSLSIMTYVLFASVSKTSIIAFSLSFLLFTLLSKGGKVKLALLTMFALCILLAYPSIQNYYLSYTDFGTLTGRTDIWDRVIAGITQDAPHFIFGNGLGALVQNTLDLKSGGYSQTHNELLNTIYHFGLLGLILMISVYGTYGVQVIRQMRSKENYLSGLFCLTLLVYFLIKGLFESSSGSFIFSPEVFCLTSLWMAGLQRQAHMPFPPEVGSLYAAYPYDKTGIPVPE